MSEPSYSGSVCQVVKQVPQTFHHINCSSHTDLPEARFSYFTEQVCAVLIVRDQNHSLGTRPSLVPRARIWLRDYQNQ